MKRFARIAVRQDNDKDPDKGCLILGLTHGDVFKPGHVYEIVEIEGEHIIRDMGVSAATPEVHPSGVTWHRDANSLILDGGHLFTIAEHAFKYIQEMPCASCGHLGQDHSRDFKCLFGSGYFSEELHGR